jgi:hypothetical protein
MLLRALVLIVIVGCVPPPQPASPAYAATSGPRNVTINGAPLDERTGATLAQLEAAGGDRYKPLYEHAARTLAAFMHDAIPVDQLPAKLKAMKKQAAEIEAMPERATEEEINEIAPDTELVPLDERDPLTEITEPLQ